MCSMRQCPLPNWKVIFGAFWHGVKYKTQENQAPPPFENRKYK